MAVGLWLTCEFIATHNVNMVSTVFSPGRVCNADAGPLLGYCTKQLLHVLGFSNNVNQTVTLKIEGVISSKT
jgi:hypothetical protein